jgi:hypothetical protein
MAYITADDVAAIREELKSTFGKKWKFGVRKGSGSLSVDVTIKQGTAAFEEAFANAFQGRKYAQVNHYWIKEHFTEDYDRAVLEKINEIMHNAPGRKDPSRKYFDESDAMTDYFHTAFYTHLQIGSWDKDYQVVEG